MRYPLYRRVLEGYRLPRGVIKGGPFAKYMITQRSYEIVISSLHGGSSGTRS
jgi:hypothetical protein